MIFPGMDPYLEDPRFWLGLHNTMIVYLRDHVRSRLPPHYIAAVDERVFIEGPDGEVRPDVWLKRSKAENRTQGTTRLVEIDDPLHVEVSGIEIHETYISILDREDDERVVTVIELISPSNKTPGDGRTLYLQKQAQVRASDTHLVEIDLLRTGLHVAAVPSWVIEAQRPYDYLISINRATGTRGGFDLYALTMRDRLPRIGIPLNETDPDVAVDLLMVFEQAYEAGSYRQRIRYNLPCRVPLSVVDQAWADELIAQSAISSL